MGRTSLSLSAIPLAVAMAVCGCALGPASNVATSDLLEGNAGWSPKATGPAEGLTAPHAGDIQLTSGVAGGPGTVERISSAFKKGVDSVSDALTPSTPVEPAGDAVSLSTEAKPGPQLYVAMARLLERSGKVEQAEAQYQQALKLDPQHAGALLGYARLKDRKGEMEAATQLYGQAARAHPNQAPIFNDLGVCLARRGVFSESIAALGEAVRLEPKKWLYRNNMAMVLVQTGKVEAALSQLTAVQSEAVACYNVAYILQKKGDLRSARTLFAMALEKNPSLERAKVWLRKVEGDLASGGRASPRVARDARPGVGPGRGAAEGTARPAPGSMVRRPGEPGRGPREVRRLPPVTARRIPPVPGVDPRSAGSRQMEPAPLPPPTSVEEPIGAGSSGRISASVVAPLPPVDGE